MLYFNRRFYLDCFYQYLKIAKKISKSENYAKLRMKYKITENLINIMKVYWYVPSSFRDQICRRLRAKHSPTRRMMVVYCSVIFLLLLLDMLCYVLRCHWENELFTSQWSVYRSEMLLFYSSKNNSTISHYR